MKKYAPILCVIQGCLVEDSLYKGHYIHYMHRSLPIRLERRAERHMSLWYGFETRRANADKYALAYGP